MNWSHDDSLGLSRENEIIMQKEWDKVVKK
jgi:hypothetical protein